ncbi:MAG: restriction endonuclease [Terrimicrobiaceae bacterium]
MPIPTYQELMLPVLQTLREHGPLHTTKCAEMVADMVDLSEQERAEMLPSGTQRYIVNRTGWAAWYMMQAGLIQRPKRGWIQITDQGRSLLATNPPKIDRQILMGYPSFVEKMSKGNDQEEGETETESEIGSGGQTPHERIDAAMAELRKSLVSDLRDQLSSVDPYRFEQIVLDLLLALGYGGSRREAAQVTQKTGDEGIDGVINEDRLGLDVIYVQAKRWAGKVGRPEIQNFVGALAGKKANKGIFITTGDFHSNAREYAGDVQHKIILIDGQRLAELMVDHNIGVSEEQIYRIKRVDSDYFDSESV